MIDNLSIMWHDRQIGDRWEVEMNRVPLARRVQIIRCLVEGNSIRSTERMTNTHRDTIMRLMVEIGEGCSKLADEQMRDGSSQLWRRGSPIGYGHLRSWSSGKP